MAEEKTIDTTSSTEITVHRDLLTLPVDGPAPDYEAIAAQEAQWQRMGRELADTLYNMTNVDVVHDLDPYIILISTKTIPVSSAQNQFMLKEAVSYFENEYGPTIKERGRSITLLDEILHRVGKEHRELVDYLLNGFDVEKLIWKIWELHVTQSEDFRDELGKLLYPLSLNQVAELREEYNRIPVRLIADELHRALYRTNLDQSPFPDIQVIKDIFLGRSEEEVDQIIYQYNLTYHFAREEPRFPEFDDVIEQLLSDGHLEEMDQLLEGFNPLYTARHIRAMLNNCVEEEEDLNPFKQLHPDFAGRFRRRYDHYPLWERELRARDAIDNETAYLTKEQFTQIASLMESRYQVRITPILYAGNLDTKPRTVALNVAKAFRSVTDECAAKQEVGYLDDHLQQVTKKNIKESRSSSFGEVATLHQQEVRSQQLLHFVELALSPLRYLSPSELREVKTEFLVTIGQGLHDFAHSCVTTLCGENPPEYVSTRLAQRLGGILHHPLTIDIFDYFQTQKQRLEANEAAKRRIRAEQKARTYCQQLIQLLAECQSTDEYDALLNFLRARSHRELLEMERYYFSSFDDDTPLLAKMRDFFPDEVYLDIDCLFQGYNTFKIAHGIKKELRSLASLLHAPADAINCTIDHFNALFEEDLIEEVKRVFGGKKFAPLFCLAMSVLYTPDATSLKALLSTEDPLDEEDLDEFIFHMAKPRLELLSFESSYNRHFARFQTCFERHYGTLLHRLRVLATDGNLPRNYFSESVLLLEGLDPSLTAELFECVKSPDISAESTITAQRLLDQNRFDLKTVQQSFNALNSAQTLREQIYSLKLPLVAKNKLLLLLDGYNAERNAKEIHEALQRLEGEQLGRHVLALLTPGKDNNRVPSHTNWTGEMHNQIRVAYEALYGKKLISELLKKKVPRSGPGVNAIALKLYGETAYRMIDFDKLLAAHASAPSAEKYPLEQSMVKILGDLVPVLRERLIDMHNAYHSWGDSTTLDTIIQARFSDATLAAQAIDLFAEATLS